MKKKSGVFLISVIILILAAATGCSGRKADDIAVEGIREFEKGNYAQALEKLRLAEEYGVDEFSEEKLYFSIGGVLFRLEDYQGSIDAYLTAIDVNPGSFDSWASLGVAYRETGDNEKADEAYEKALSLDPEDETSVLLYDNLGYKYITENKPFHAIKYLEKAEELSPENAATYGLLSMAYAMGYEYEKSDEAFQKAEELGYSQIETLSERIREIKADR